MFFQIKLFAILCIVGFLFALPAFCAEEVETNSKEKEDVFTQGELAVAIVRSLGLENEIGFDRSKQAYMTFLQSRGIVPLIDGVYKWDPDAEVTKEVLAVVVVQTLGLRSEVQDTTNVGDYIRVLDDRDISIEDVRKVLSNIFVVNVLTEVIGPTRVERLMTPTVGF